MAGSGLGQWRLGADPDPAAGCGSAPTGFHDNGTCVSGADANFDAADFGTRKPGDGVVRCLGLAMCFIRVPGGFVIGAGFAFNILFMVGSSLMVFWRSGVELGTVTRADR